MSEWPPGSLTLGTCPTPRTHASQGVHVLLQVAHVNTCFLFKDNVEFKVGSSQEEGGPYPRSLLCGLSLA